MPGNGTPTTLRAARGPAVWRAAELSDGAWSLAPSAEAVAEWEGLLTGDRPPGPGLRALAGSIAERLHDGPGFAAVRGLPSPDADDAARSAALLELTALLGTPAPQTAEGDRVYRIEDRGGAFTGATRGGVTNAALGFHTDGRDWVGLYCVRAAGRGGISSVTSSGAIHNALLESEPELLQALYEPWHFDRRGAPGPPTLVAPVFGRRDGVVSCFYVPHTLRSGPERIGEPLDPLRERALDRFDALAAAEELRIDMRLEPGDLQFVNNLALVHARSAFSETGDCPGRLLLRVWLDSPRPWPLSPGFRGR